MDEGAVMRMRKGFTLMEMLVVIVTLGILSAVMLLSSLEAVSSADASNIINNMQQIKMATYAWYKDNLSRLIPDGSGGYKIRTKGTDQKFSEFIRDHKSEISQYLDNANTLILRSTEDSSNNTGDYTLIEATVNKRKSWYVCYNSGTKSTTITNYGEEAPELRIKDKIAGRAKTLQLLGKTDIKNNTFQSVYTDQKWICMLILQLP